ncbi:hypothetical protein D3C76_1329410 [compost metagenome]
MQIDPVVGFEDEAEVDWRVLDLVVVLRLVLVVVAFVFELQRQWVPGRLVSYAAKEGGRSAEVLVAVEVTRLTIVGSGTFIELVVEPAQRIVHVTTIADVTPCQAQAQVKIAKAFVADKIFAGEQAGTTNVSRTQRHLRHPVRLFEQTHFGVDRLVFIALVATQR